MRAWSWKLAFFAGALVFAGAIALLFGSLTTAPVQQRFRRADAARAVADAGPGTEEAASLQQLSAAVQQQAAAAAAAQVSAAREGASCTDAHADCPAWAQAGDCTRNPEPLLTACRHSCGVCKHLTRPQLRVRKTVQLSNGRLMPLLGFGTAGLGDGTYAAVKTALAAGYRLIDTAQAVEWYREGEVGRAIANSPAVNRSQLFLTTKLHPRDFGRAAERVGASLAALRTTYLDLLLLHYPRCWPGVCSAAQTAAAPGWREAWAALEPLVAAGTVRALGVSNFSPAELGELLAVARVRPAVVQAHSDPFAAAVPLQALCARAGVQFQGYSTLGTQWLMRGHARNPVLASPAVAAVAAAHACSPAQAVLRWALQHRQAVVPRSASAEHMAANLAVLAADDPLSAAEMRALDALDGTLG